MTSTSCLLPISARQPTCKALYIAIHACNVEKEYYETQQIIASLTAQSIYIAVVDQSKLNQSQCVSLSIQWVCCQLFEWASCVLPVLYIYMSTVYRKFVAVLCIGRTHLSERESV